MPPIWPDQYRDQVEYISDLERRINDLKRRSEVASFLSTEAPTRSDLATAWSLHEGKSLQAPPFSKTQWFNPEKARVENVYLNLPQFSLDPFALQIPAASLPDLELIAHFVQQQNDPATVNFTASWTKVYRAIWFYWSLRATNAAIASTLQIQANALTGAIYSHCASRLDQSPQLTFDSSYLNANGWSVASIPGGTAPNPALFGQGQGILYYPDMTTQAKSGFFDAIHLTNDASGATELRYNSGGWHVNTLSAITSLKFVPQGGFGVGSKIVVMGLYPQS